MKIRPKGSDKPFQPVHAQRDGMYAIKWHYKGAIFGKGFTDVQYYKPEELEVME